MNEKRMNRIVDVALGVALYKVVTGLIGFLILILMKITGKL